MLIDELIHKMGWIQRSKDGNRQKIENRILTNNFSDEELSPHHTTAQVLLALCCGECKWEFFMEEERKNLTKNRLIQDMREPKQYLKAVLTKKRICYIRKGKVTFAYSFNFEKMTDGMFEMEYDELTFLIRPYEAIGFLGRNLRFSDSPSFYRLQYFIQRYLSDATLDFEFRHLWKVYEDLMWHKTPLILIDSRGIDSRRKSLFAKIHGRSHTIGFADVRAISLYLIPVFSSNCRSSNSEFGKIFTSREHIFADGVNARNLQRDLRMHIVWNSKQKGYDLDDLIQLVEVRYREHTKW
jgi:hypothetical protein